MFRCYKLMAASNKHFLNTELIACGLQPLSRRLTDLPIEGTGEIADGRFLNFLHSTGYL